MTSRVRKIDNAVKLYHQKLRDQKPNSGEKPKPKSAPANKPPSMRIPGPTTIQ